MTDGATSPSQGVTENGQEDNWCNEALESEEILNLGGVSHFVIQERLAVGLYLGVRYA